MTHGDFLFPLYSNYFVIIIQFKLLLVMTALNHYITLHYIINHTFSFKILHTYARGKHQPCNHCCANWNDTFCQTSMQNIFFISNYCMKHPQFVVFFCWAFQMQFFFVVVVVLFLSLLFFLFFILLLLLLKLFL